MRMTKSSQIHRAARNKNKASSKVAPTLDEENDQNSNEIPPEREPNLEIDDKIKSIHGIESNDEDIMEELNLAATMLQKTWLRSRNKKKNKGKEKERTTWSREILIEVLEASMVKQRREKMRNIVIYAIFLYVFASANLSDYDDDKLFNFTENVKGQFIDVEFNEADSPTWGKTFRDIGTVQELYQWFDGPFLGAAYTSSSFDGDPHYTTNNRGYMLGYNQIVGGIRIGQLRVQRQTCTEKISQLIPSMLNSEVELYCYGGDKGNFDLQSESREDFGTYYDETGSEPKVRSSAEKFTFLGWNETDTEVERQLMFSSVKTEYQKTFPSPGFSVVLPRENATRAKEMLSYLRNNHYVDLQTRALFVDVNVYNVMLEYISVLRLIFELPPSGGVITTYSAVTVPFSKNYLISPDKYLSALKIIELLFYTYFVFQEAREISKEGFSYFKKVSTWVQQLNLFIYVFVWGYKFSAILHFPDEFPVNEDKFVTFRSYSEGYMVSQYLNACNAFLCWFKMISYLSDLVTQFEVVTVTLGNAAMGLSGFVFIFFIITYAYASAYLMTFGTKLREYSTMRKTIFTLFRSLLGDFDLDSMVREHAVMGVLLFALFVLVAVFVVLNLLIAIISESYETAQNAMERKKQELQPRPLLEEIYDYLLSIVFSRVERIDNWIKTVEEADKVDNSNEGSKYKKDENEVKNENGTNNVKNAKNEKSKLSALHHSCSRKIAFTLRDIGKSCSVPKSITERLKPPFKRTLETENTDSSAMNASKRDGDAEPDLKVRETPNHLNRIAKMNEKTWKGGFNDSSGSSSSGGGGNGNGGHLSSASEESVELLKGMVLQLALQNEKLHSKMEQMHQQIVDLAMESREQRKLHTMNSISGSSHGSFRLQPPSLQSQLSMKSSKRSGKG